MNRSDLVIALLQKTGMDVADSEWFVRTFFEVLANGLKQDERVELRGFGVFRLTTRNQAGFHNPKDGCYYGSMPIRCVRFQPSLLPVNDAL